jgi:hypothetical protein
VLASRLSNSTDDQQQTHACPGEFQALEPINRNNAMLQFRNDSGLPFNKSGQEGGLYVIHGRKARRSQCVLSKDLITVRSGVNVRAVAATQQSSRSAYRRALRPSTAGAHDRMQPSFALWLRDQPVKRP